MAQAELLTSALSIDEDAIHELVIGPEHNGMLMTPEEFDEHDVWDENYRYELIEGVLVVNPPPAEGERGPNDYLGAWLIHYRDATPQGSSLDDTLPEQHVPGTPNRRRADRVIWCGLGRRPNVRQDVPTIVIEFVAPGRRSWRRDYIAKRDEYLAAGVKVYWIIDRFRRTMTVCRRSEAGFEEQVVGESEHYRPSLLPGFELPLGPLLAVADRWNV